MHDTRDILVIGLHQAAPGTGLAPEVLDFYARERVQLLVLPEYFWVRPSDANHAEAARHAAEDEAQLRTASLHADWVLVGGTFVETRDGALHNACTVWRGGREIARYRKRHLMPGEHKSGIVPGDAWVASDAPGYRLAPILCADVLQTGTFAEVGALAPQVIAAPMASPFLEGEPQENKLARDRELFEAGARRAGALVVKVGGPGPLFGRPLQGRCLVAGPEGVQFRTPFGDERAERRWVVRSTDPRARQT